MATAAAASATVAKTATPAAAASQTIAFLGPKGTYGEQAATRFASRLGGPLILTPVPTISAIYTHPADYLVFPLENTLHGAVTDTVDSLLTPCSPAQPSMPYPRAIGDTSLRIEHQLVARAGTTLADITQVRSHEQALGQSSAWLARHLPGAKRVGWPSTAGALASILEGTAADTAGVAAICSRAAYEAHAADLTLLHAGTQGAVDNYTRFLLLTRLPLEELDIAPLHDGTAAGTVVSFFACDEPAQIGGLAQGGVVLSAHQRPAPAGTTDEHGAALPFPRWTLVEMEDAHPYPEGRCGALLVGVFPTEKIGAAEGVIGEGAGGAEEGRNGLYDGEL